MPIYSFYKGSRIISKITLSQRHSLASRGGKEFYVGHMVSVEPEGVEFEAPKVPRVDMSKGWRMGRGYPLQPTRGSGGAS